MSENIRVVDDRTTEAEFAEMADFLLARIAEDEAATPPEGYEKRMADECRAKRWLVNLAVKVNSNPMSHGILPTATGAREGLEAALDAIAFPYSDHPDFRDEWRNPPNRFKP